MDEFKIPINNCNIISDRESFSYNYRLMKKYIIKPHITTISLFQNNNMYHCNCNNQLLQLQWLLELL